MINSLKDTKVRQTAENKKIFIIILRYNFSKILTLRLIHEFKICL